MQSPIWQTYGAECSALGVQNRKALTAAVGIPFTRRQHHLHHHFIFNIVIFIIRIVVAIFTVLSTLIPLFR